MSRDVPDEIKILIWYRLKRLREEQGGDNKQFYQYICQKAEEIGFPRENLPTQQAVSTWTQRNRPIFPQRKYRRLLAYCCGTSVEKMFGRTTSAIAQDSLYETIRYMIGYLDPEKRARLVRAIDVSR